MKKVKIILYTSSNVSLNIINEFKKHWNGDKVSFCNVTKDFTEENVSESFDQSIYFAKDYSYIFFCGYCRKVQKALKKKINKFMKTNKSIVASTLVSTSVRKCQSFCFIAECCYRYGGFQNSNKTFCFGDGGLAVEQQEEFVSRVELYLIFKYVQGKKLLPIDVFAEQISLKSYVDRIIQEYLSKK